jgi:hypothetical protein
MSQDQDGFTCPICGEDDSCECSVSVNSCQPVEFMMIIICLECGSEIRSDGFCGFTRLYPPTKIEECPYTNKSLKDRPKHRLGIATYRLSGVGPLHQEEFEDEHFEGEKFEDPDESH